MGDDPAAAALGRGSPRSVGEPSLTALVPCYNEEACLERAYREIAAELGRFTDCEILFVDDGSTDRTLELIKAIARTDERVRPMLEAFQCDLPKPVEPATLRGH